MNAIAEFVPHGPVPPREAPEGSPLPEPEIDDRWPLEFDDETWDALVPDDDYEPQPEYGDFWTEQDAA